MEKVSKQAVKKGFNNEDTDNILNYSNLEDLTREMELQDPRNPVGDEPC